MRIFYKECKNQENIKDAFWQNLKTGVQCRWDRSDGRKCKLRQQNFSAPSTKCNQLLLHSIWENKTSCRAPLLEIALTFPFRLVPLFQYKKHAILKTKQVEQHNSWKLQTLWDLGYLNYKKLSL